MRCSGEWQRPHKPWRSSEWLINQRTRSFLQDRDYIHRINSLNTELADLIFWRIRSESEILKKYKTGQIRWHFTLHIRSSTTQLVTLLSLIMSKLITVFGATGNQGGSVIDAILADPQLSKDFKIRGVTRDTTKKSARDLADRGVEVVTVSSPFTTNTDVNCTKRMIWQI